ncbi:cbb3-type cytochrome oxidase maturation protein [Palleronia aestuarii]|uniref:Cbb3-type cytochrome oxidase maturation protein n=1 Tax=Palleronia aestuarii TaxID=568105 RepID=A0A2W7MTN3_9RHOB|nr:cbb3-type cytochrome oxidase assembly protein CcoS [Palleronia aestuarii]PZX10903.1 cbb3-type cytochrome oxidase maturation protein [Palleronia aestuarii]
MNVLVVLIPVSVCLGVAGLLACLWTLRHGQYDDLEGDAARILLEDLDGDRADSATAQPEKT